MDQCSLCACVIRANKLWGMFFSSESKGKNPPFEKPEVVKGDIWMHVAGRPLSPFFFLCSSPSPESHDDILFSVINSIQLSSPLFLSLSQPGPGIFFSVSVVGHTYGEKGKWGKVRHARGEKRRNTPLLSFEFSSLWDMRE